VYKLTTLSALVLISWLELNGIVCSREGLPQTGDVARANSPDLGRRYESGDAVWVRRTKDNMWYPRTIIQVGADRAGQDYYQVTYPGHPHSWNEWVHRDRLRPR
jgi:hypothetical protein